ncbi:DUF4998 domain-containing protein [Botryobacter ruber]|uniref:DUF4998 domain-containing protein n=1 Tax=Botryobacter ruber TaxID=2171629 RepID=UPI0013E3A10A|nr:DUF4998 domain-containing protein [Botryobacter ruber]
MKTVNLKFYATIALSLVFLLAGCEKEDEAAVVVEKEIDRVTSVKSCPGRNRVKLWWKLPADERVVKSKVTWNDETLSREIPVVAGKDTLSIIIDNLIEGNHTFTIYVLDKGGKLSEKVNVNAQAYGSQYEAALQNRAIKKLNYNAETSAAEIDWESAALGVVGAELEYTDAAAVAHTLFISPFSRSTTLDGFKTGESFRYRTLHMPNSSAIDTFYTAYETVEVLHLDYSPPVDDDGNITPPSILAADPAKGASATFGLIGSGNVEAPSSITTDHDPVRGLVWRFQKPVSSNRCENHGIKVNGAKYEFKNNNTYYFGWWSKLTDNSNNNANFQWKSYGDHIQNFPIVLKMRDGNMILQQRQPGGIETILWSAPWKANTWYKLALGIHVSDALRGGWIELWFNGVKQTFSDDSQRYYCRTFDGGHNCPKWGIYGRSDLAISNYIDNIKVGTSYEEVD